jgi:hypothetical protein
MSGFTHRVTNQIHGASARGPKQIKQLLDCGWIDDPLWLLRTVHEIAHVNLNFTPVAEALVLTELSLDRAIYQSMSSHDVPTHLFEIRDSVSLAYDLLDPWVEAVALSIEWDLDHSSSQLAVTHEWMGKLIGLEEYDAYLWRARVCPLGVGKKANTFASSCYRTGHLLGHLLARSLMLPGDRLLEEVVADIVRCIFFDVELAHAILDLAEGPRSHTAVDGRRSRLVESVGAAVDRLLSQQDAEATLPLQPGQQELQQRMQPLLEELERPVQLWPHLPRSNDDIGDAGEACARACFAMRTLIGLGTAPVQLAVDEKRVICSADGVEVYAFRSETEFDGVSSGTIEVTFCALCGSEARGVRVSSDTHGVLHCSANDDHMLTAFRRAGLPTQILENALSAAELLAGAMRAGGVSSQGQAKGKELAAWLAGTVIENATGAEINVESMRDCGVGAALDRNPARLETLALLSIASSALLTSHGRAALQTRPAVGGEQFADLSQRLARTTGLPLAAKTRSRIVALW